MDCSKQKIDSFVLLIITQITAIVTTLSLHGQKIHSKFKNSLLSPNGSLFCLNYYKNFLIILVLSAMSAKIAITMWTKIENK